MPIDPSPNPVKMDRYIVQNIAVAPDYSSMMVRYTEVDQTDDDVVLDTIERVIDLRGIEEGRERIWQVVELVCDLLDDAHRANLKQKQGKAI